MGTSRPSEAAVEQRRQEILRHVIDHGEARIDVLAEQFRVSLMTMHRDLDDLAARQLLRKLRGLVAAFPSLTMETATRFRQTLHGAEKDLLSAAVLDEVQPGHTVIMDDSTTLFPLARRLAAMEQLTVVTNSVRIAQILSRPDGVAVVLVGGRYQHEFDSCTGPDVLRFLARLRADVSFMSATAVAGGRLFHPIQDYAEIKEEICRSAASNILLVDHHKFGKTATFAYGDVRAYDLVVTDADIDPSELEAIRGLDVAVRVVDKAAGERPR
jgi:DeoR/GlpR family transcriptional regulator of sugar metabolism